MSTFTEAEAGPSTAVPGLHERLSRATAGRQGKDLFEKDDEQDGDDRSVDSDDLFDELERELDEQGGRGGGMMGRLREERMEELRRQWVVVWRLCTQTLA